MQTTKSELSKILGLTERRIGQLVADGVIPQATRGKFDTARAVQGYVRAVEQRRDLPSLQQAKIQKLELERQLLQVELDVKGGSLVPVAEAILVWSKYVSSARAFIDGHPLLSREDKDTIIGTLGQLMDSHFTLPTSSSSDEQNRTGDRVEGKGAGDAEDTSKS